MTELPPVVLSIEVPTGVDDAFSAFTDRVDAWWPAQTHSVGEERVAKVVLEDGPGGRFYEEWDDGTRIPWGEVLTWEPPHRVVFSWYPGLDPEESTEVEVIFTPAAGGTSVQLTHRNWERRGANAAEKRAMYESGWPVSLERFRDEAVRSSAGSAP